MKKLFISLIILFTVLLSSLDTFAQIPPPPPDPGGNPCNTNGTQVGGPSAPLGDGIWLLVALAAAYGIRRINHKGKSEEPVS
ncbi:MAG: hypothetical protein IPH88_05815 [Bacteroidales bacterium]|nr:hypothetical protein [Bacteroidales bacterium]